MNVHACTQTHKFNHPQSNQNSQHRFSRPKPFRYQKKKYQEQQKSINDHITEREREREKNGTYSVGLISVSMGLASDSQEPKISDLSIKGLSSVLSTDSIFFKDDHTINTSGVMPKEKIRTFYNLPQNQEWCLA